MEKIGKTRNDSRDSEKRSKTANTDITRIALIIKLIVNQIKVQEKQLLPMIFMNG
jgi:hypothetical protein